MLNNNWLALLVTLVIALTWLRLMDFAAQRGWIGSRLSRKIIHIGTGPIFVLCWVFFTDAEQARFLAALVPGGITLQFLLVGLGVMRDEGSVQSMTRHGDRREILRGPLFYGIVFVVLTLLYWRESPIGIIALMVLCGGDGLADIIGRRFGAQKLPWNKGKSWMGSLGMLLGSWIFAMAIMAFFIAQGYFSVSLAEIFLPVTLIALVCTLVESLPVHDIDNLTISLAAVLVGQLVF
ncbi:MAG: phosphatidate cytidylyltransferase [Anaerolineales bacterium]|jgi:phytol kinase|nr:phosphatidate cytidylyltransferase [Anaerolineales bacterium]